MSTIAGFLLNRVSDDHTAVVDASGSWTWRETVQAGLVRAACADELRGEGPFHIGVLLPNVPEFMFWLCGAALAGAAVVGINPTRRGDSLAADIRNTDCQLLVTDDDGAALLEGLDLGMSEDKVLVIGTERYETLLKESARRDDSLESVRETAAKLPDDQLFLLLFTSGTTGTPKAVRCTQGRLAGIAEYAAPGYGCSRDSVCYCIMPLFHGNALMALWGPAVYTGATVALRPRFSASEFLSDVRAFKVTMFSFVGKAIAYILATPEQPDDRDNTLINGFGTEASLRDRKRFYERFGAYLIEGYGQSEGGAAINPVQGMPRGSLGQPVDGIDMAIINPETAEECPPARFDDSGQLLNSSEAIGEMVNRTGTGRFEGYYNAPEAEAARTRNGWYWTGDLGYRDADGFFFFAGRGGDWLRVDGENFSAGPIEVILSRHPDVKVAAVYPVPDTRGGDQVMAAFELEARSTFDGAAFGDWLAAQGDFGTKWAPRYVRITESLPETATGKVTKGPLRDEAWNAADAVWWRPERERAYRLLTDDDRDALRAELTEHGRAHLVR